MTSSALAIPQLAPNVLSPRLEELADQAVSFARLAKAPNTRRAYDADWRAFSQWCGENRCVAAPASPQVIALYVTHLAKSGKKANSISRALAAIASRHTILSVHDKNAGPSPTKHPLVVETMAGIRRSLGTARTQKRPTTIDDVLGPMVRSLPEGIRGVRDRAILLVGFAGGFRRSELAAIRMDDVTFEREGVTIHLHRSKTDKEGKGTAIAISYGAMPSTCPVSALRAWMDELEGRGLASGAVFRGIDRRGRIQPSRSAERDAGKLISRVVKRAAQVAGLDPGSFGAHSLRAGLATQAAIKGKSLDLIAKGGRWTSLDTVLGYIRRVNQFKDNVTAGLGL